MNKIAVGTLLLFKIHINFGNDHFDGSSQTFFFVLFPLYFLCFESTIEAIYKTEK